MRVPFQRPAVAPAPAVRETMVSVLAPGCFVRGPNLFSRAGSDRRCFFLAPRRTGGGGPSEPVRSFRETRSLAGAIW